MIRIILLASILTIFQQTIFGQFEKYSSFVQMDSLWVGYMHKNQLDSAISVYEYAQKAFSDHDKEITLKLGFLYTLTKKDSLALAIISYGQANGYYFALHYNQYIDHFKDNIEFIKMAKRDKQIGDSLNNVSHVEYEVKLPKNYSKDCPYPLLIVFHGNGGSIKTSKGGWNSKIMNDNFITVYFQSYVHGLFNAYDWIVNDEKTNKEIRALYDRILLDYSVDKDKIYLLGFSAGGTIAIDYAFDNFIPVSGLILNCPSRSNVSDSSIIDFVDKDKRIVIITGEKDWALNEQKELIDRINKAEGKSRIIIKEGIGHQFSRDFPDLLDEYLTWINE